MSDFSGHGVLCYVILIILGIHRSDLASSRESVGRDSRKSVSRSSRDYSQQPRDAPLVLPEQVRVSVLTSSKQSQSSQIHSLYQNLIDSEIKTHQSLCKKIPSYVFLTKECHYASKACTLGPLFQEVLLLLMFSKEEHPCLILTRVQLNYLRKKLFSKNLINGMLLQETFFVDLSIFL